MAKTGDDCYFFYSANCIKGNACPYRHVEEARGSVVTCPEWLLNRCFNIACNKRHMELQPQPGAVPCYFESQPGGCTKPNCNFQHKFPRGAPPHLPPHGPPHVPVSAPPTGVIVRPSQPGWPVARGPAPGPTYTRPPPLGHRPPWAATPRPFPTPGYNPFHPPTQPPPTSYSLDQSGDVNMLQVEPVIINLHSEESDQESIKGASPVKPVRSTVTSTASATPNPLDYFLNAKPWVDPSSTRETSRRSESPPFRRRRSSSPVRRSMSPVDRSSPGENRDRRRSVSVDRQVRRRSHSADRSGSPEWRDRRRFARRSRSPERRRSRSPPRGRGRGRGPTDLRSRLKPAPNVPLLEEVKVTGSKIISIKKDKAEEEERESKKEEEVSKEPTKGDFEKEPVKSLEEIYRERALLSLMEAKRKKIQESKRKRWEGIKQSDTRTSESERSDKSEKSETSVTDRKHEKDREEEVEEEEEEKEEEVDSSSDSEAADIDLDADVDIELGEGELEAERQEEEEEEEEEETEKQTDSRRIRSSVKSSRSAKPSIKSRLGLRAVEEVAKQAKKERRPTPSSRARSVKERLGVKLSGAGDASDRTRNSGVVRLSRKGDEREIIREIRGIVRSRSRKDPLVVPQITINNTVDIEERKTDVKQRLGLLDDDGDSDGKRRKKKDSLDEELFRLLREENVDIEESEMGLLTKKEKKKLLKKLLAQQGREDEYDSLKKRKKKSSKRKRDKTEDGEKSSGRKIQLQRHDPSSGQSGEEEEEELASAEEIELGEDIETVEESHEQEESDGVEDEIIDTVADAPAEKPQTVVFRPTEEMQREKEARLREALEPKTLEDIRRERREKRATGDPSDARKITVQRRGRIIVERAPDEMEKKGPQVKVTFEGLDSYTKRKLPRIAEPAEQNENKQPTARPSGARGIKRDRQIYVPAFKRTEAPVETTCIKKAGPPAGREIINYGDAFPKKPTTTVTSQAAVEKPSFTSSTSTSSTVSGEKRPPLKLQRGPPKVEVKDATVKTFAEIMAEKKRKRLLAQQGGQKSTISSRQLNTGADDESHRPSVSDRLSDPSPSVSLTTTLTTTLTSPVKRPPPADTEIKPSSNIASNLQTSSKSSRWKRRKTLESQQASDDKERLEENVVKSEAATVQSPIIKSTNVASNILPKREIPEVSETTQPKKDVKEQPPLEKSISAEAVDFDDHLLSMSDDDELDLELTGTQDHDELMREIDELLA